VCRKITKILYLIDELQPAGTEKQHIMLAENLSRREFDPVIGVLQATPFISQLRLRTPIVNFNRRGLFFLKNMKVLACLHSYLRLEKVALVQTQFVDSGILGALAMLGLPRRPVLVATRRNAYHSISEQPWMFRLNRLAAQRADAMVVNSRCVAGQCARLEHIAWNRIRLIENGVEISRFGRVPREEARRGLGFSETGPLIGVVANWRPVKGLKHFLEAATLIHQSIPAANFALVGQGAQKEELMAYARRSGLARQVHFLEGITEPADVIAAFDVAVQCSLSESFSGVLLEYMAAEKPIVATRVGDAEQILQDGINGLLIDPADPVGLSEAVLSMLQNPEASLEMGKRCRARVEQRYSLERMTEDYQHFYSELLQRHSSSASN